MFENVPVRVCRCGGIMQLQDDGKWLCMKCFKISNRSGAMFGWSDDDDNGTNGRN